MRVLMVIVGVLAATLVLCVADGGSMPPASAAIVAQGRHGGQRSGRGGVFKLTCKLCGGSGKMKQREGLVADCIACRNGRVVVRLRAGDGICPDCGGTTWVKEDSGDEGAVLSVSGASPCSTCLGGGTLPLNDGGTREGLEPAGSSGRQVSSQDSESDSDDSEPEPDVEEGFFMKYRIWLIAGGGGLLVLALVASKTSKKGK